VAVDIDVGVVPCSDPDPAAPFANPRRWFRRHYPLVWDAIRRFGVPRDELEDALQETFLIAYRGRARFSGGSMSAWLYAIARRVASNRRRAHDRRVRGRARLAAHEPETADRTLDERAALRIVDDFLAALAPIDREIFVLSEVDGLTGPEIAEALGRNLATVYTRVRTLRERFAAYCEDPRAALLECRARRPRAKPAAWLFLPALARVVPVAGVTWNTGVAALAVAVVGGITAISADGHGTAPRRALSVDLRAHAPVPSASPRATLDTAPAQPLEPDPAAAARAMPVAPAPDRIAAPLRRRPSPTEPGNTAPAGEVDGEGPRPAPGVDVPADPESSLWLQQAASALRRGEVEAATDLLERHAARFPDSAMADVRTALTIEADCAAGRTTRARQAAARFLADHPNSLVAGRVRRACPTPR
jgi:RNA polymerase sigma-70 factor, ECF subfamily